MQILPFCKELVLRRIIIGKVDGEQQHNNSNSSKNKNKNMNKRSRRNEFQCIWRSESCWLCNKTNFWGSELLTSKPCVRRKLLPQLNEEKERIFQQRLRAANKIRDYPMFWETFLCTFFFLISHIPHHFTSLLGQATTRCVEWTCVSVCQTSKILQRCWYLDGRPGEVALLLGTSGYDGMGPP